MQAGAFELAAELRIISGEFAGVEYGDRRSVLTDWYASQPREKRRAARLFHSGTTKLCHTFPQAPLRHRHCVCAGSPGTGTSCRPPRPPLWVESFFSALCCCDLGRERANLSGWKPHPFWLPYGTSGTRALPDLPTQVDDASSHPWGGCGAVSGFRFTGTSSGACAPPRELFGSRKACHPEWYTSFANAKVMRSRRTPVRRLVAETRQGILTMKSAQ